MENKLEQRLEELKTEFESGQKVLAELDAKQASVKNTLIRISGAIQVLEEILNSQHESNKDNSVNESKEAELVAAG